MHGSPEPAPVSNNSADGFSDPERAGRLERLCRAYGTMFPWAEVLRAITARLEHLAKFSDHMAVKLSNHDLAGHARLYRADAHYIETELLQGG